MGTGPPPPDHTYLPGVGQATDGRVAEAKHDGKEGIEILLLLEAVSGRPRGPQGKQPHPQSSYPDNSQPAARMGLGQPLWGLQLDGLGIHRLS